MQGAATLCPPLCQVFLIYFLCFLSSETLNSSKRSCLGIEIRFLCIAVGRDLAIRRLLTDYRLPAHVGLYTVLSYSLNNITVRLFRVDSVGKLFRSVSRLLSPEKSCTRMSSNQNFSGISQSRCSRALSIFRCRVFQHNRPYPVVQ